MTPFKKNILGLITALLLVIFPHSVQALNQTDFQKLTEPVSEQSLNAFRGVPLYYLESPPGNRFIQTLPPNAQNLEPQNIIHFFLNPQAGEAYRIQNKNSSGQTGFIKKISLPSILKAIHSQSRLETAALKSQPLLSISAGEGPSEVFFYALTDTKNSKPYSLEFRKKKTIPAFVSKTGAESLAKIITDSGTGKLRLETYNFEEFLIFLKLQKISGIPVRVFPYTSRPQYTVIRPMTWGVASSYLFGAALVLFLFWAITRNSNKK